MATFSKPALSIPDLLQKWKSRGLAVEDDIEARLYLRFIGYYRFSAYTLPFQQAHQSDKPFIAGASFRQVLDLYRFDRELRLHVLDAIERIEVAVRASFVNETSMLWGPHWYMNPKRFSSKYDHDRLIRKIEGELGIPRGSKAPGKPHQEQLINHYYKAYGQPYLPPVWMVCECLSFGTWSQMYANLAGGPDRQKIAVHFGLNEAILTNWLHVLSYVRNMCAHHSRLWNRQFVIKFRIAQKHRTILKCEDRFYALAVVVHEMLQKVAPGSEWHVKLAKLLTKYPSVGQQKMGFPLGWQTEPFWIIPSNSSP